MDFHVLSLFSPAEAERFTAAFDAAQFTDGRATAQGAARAVKHNLQAERTPQLLELDKVFFAALQSNAGFQRFAHPRRVLAPTYCRYDPGMEYGWHIDGAVMGANPLRTDLAMTLFLSPPASYDGGELTIRMPLGDQSIKLDAGQAVVYPASTLHCVAPITRGVRKVAITWIQSSVRDERLRGILHDLATACITAEAAADSETLLYVSKSYHNLLRHTAEL